MGYVGCQRCRKYKKEGLFPVDRRNSTGRSSWCRACKQEATGRWRARRGAALRG